MCPLARYKPNAIMFKCFNPQDEAFAPASAVPCMLGIIYVRFRTSKKAKPNQKTVKNENFQSPQPFSPFLPRSPSHISPGWSSSLPFPSAQSLDPRTPSLQLIQMLQPRQNNLLARLLNLPGQKHLIQYRIHLNPSTYQPKPPNNPYHPNPSHSPYVPCRN